MNESSAAKDGSSSKEEPSAKADEPSAEAEGSSSKEEPANKVDESSRGWDGSLSKEERAQMDREAEEYANKLLETPGLEDMGEEVCSF